MAWSTRCAGNLYSTQVRDKYIRKYNISYMHRNITYARTKTGDLDWGPQCHMSSLTNGNVEFKKGLCSCH